MLEASHHISGRLAVRCSMSSFMIFCCWRQGKFPQDFCYAIIMTLYRTKGDQSGCSNYRGITILSIVCKVLTRVLLNWLVPTIANENLPESQFGFRVSRDTTYMVFVLRQLQEKCLAKTRDCVLHLSTSQKLLTPYARPNYGLS